MAKIDWLTIALTTGLFAHSLSAQYAVPPPPMPQGDIIPVAAHSGPSLDDTIAFLQAKLKDQGALNWTTKEAYNGTPLAPEQNSFSYPEVKLVSRCYISIARQGVRNVNDVSIEASAAAEFSLSDIGKIVVEASQSKQQAANPNYKISIQPDVFDITIYSSTGKYIKVRDGRDAAYPSTIGVLRVIPASTAEIRDDGANVGIYTGGPAANGGLKPGDVIVELGGQPIKNFDDLNASVTSHAPGSAVQVVYVRDGNRISGTIAIGEHVEKQWSIAVADEETAGHVAKALNHAVELCGGGNKDLF